MILQYYVTESATGKKVNIEVDMATKEDLEATKEDLEVTKMAGRRSGTQTSSSIRRRKSMPQRPKRARSSRWAPTVSEREAWPFILPIWRASRKATLP